MDLAPLVRAAEVLMSPLERGSRDAWLAESLALVRHACGPGGESESDALGGLETLLRLPGDEPGWLHAALDSDIVQPRVGALPAMAGGSEALLPVLSLRCALAAGLSALQRLSAWRTGLGQALDEVDTGMAIYVSDGGREVARNAHWDELLMQEPERERLRRVVARRAEEVAASAAGTPDDAGLELAGGSYRLMASRAAPGSLLPEASVLVLLVRMSPGLPTTQELRISFGLRGREPQVALLAAEGLSNAAIAERLRLSAHTVRHYLERVLDRLGLHSRKALALRLMTGGAERPPADSGPSKRTTPS